MKAMIIQAPRKPLVLSDRPTPKPSKGEVLVRVVATAVNRADLLQVQGLYPAPEGSPADIPGLEFSGVIAGLGEGVTSWSEGDHVTGLVGGGSYAEFLTVHARALSGAPKSVSLVEAAALPEALLTAYDAIVVQGHCRSGDALLVHAAASGIGTAAVQIGRAIGAHVIATSRSEAKLARVLALGADVGLTTTDAKFADAVKKATEGRGADVILDLVGGAYVAEDIRAAANKARIMLIGLTAGRAAEVELGEILRKRLTIQGSVLRSRPIEEKIALAEVFTRHLLPLVERGSLAPVIERTFTLEEAAKAHELVASNQTFGKVLLTVGEPGT